MICCPHCGTETRGRTDCHACGGALDSAVRTDGGRGRDDGDGSDGSNRSQDGRQPQGGQPQGGQPQGGQPQGGQPQGGQPQGGQGYTQQQGGQRQGGQPPQGPPQGGRQGGRRGGGDDGLSRRQLLLGGGGGLAVLGGLWFFVLGDDGGDPTSSPDSAAKGYAEALANGDNEQAEELIHDDAGDLETGAGFAFQAAEAAGISVEGSTVVDEDISWDEDNHDDVEEFETVEVTLSGPEGEEDEIPMVVAENPEGEWKVWSVGFF